MGAEVVVRGGWRLRRRWLVGLLLSAATRLPSAEFLGALSVASALCQHALAACPLMPQTLHTGRCERRGSLPAALCAATQAAAVAVLVAALLDIACCWSSR